MKFYVEDTKNNKEDLSQKEPSPLGQKELKRMSENKAKKVKG